MKHFCGVLLTIFSILLFCLLGEGVFRILERNEKLVFNLIHEPWKKTGLFEYDPDLGWKNKANFHSMVKWLHGKKEEKINKRGWRDKEYKFEKVEDVYRIAFPILRDFGFSAVVFLIADVMRFWMNCSSFLKSSFTSFPFLTLNKCCVNILHIFFVMTLTNILITFSLCGTKFEGIWI